MKNMTRNSPSTWIRGFHPILAGWRKSLLIPFLCVSAIASATTYTVDFEDAAKTGYASGTVSLAGINWDMTDALIGNSASDFYSGTKSARLRGTASSMITMLGDKTGGIGTISFQYRSYGTDPQVQWIVEYSMNSGSSWTQAGTFTATATIQNFSADVNESGAGRIRIRTAATGTSNRRANVDDISITDSGAPSTAPTISSIIPNAANVGDSVTISGTNLASPASVTFTTSSGTVAATVTSSSATEIVCTVPTGAITGTVAVTTADGSATAYFRSLGPIALPYGPENFETDQGIWFSYDAAGTGNWSRVMSNLGGGVTNGPANGSMQMNGYGSDVAANDWLIAGPFDMTDVTDPVVAFNALTQFTSVAGTGEMHVMVSTDFPGVGDPSAANWTDLTFNKPVSDLNKTPSGQVVLTGASGHSSVYVAFHYIAGGTTNGTTALWQIDDIELYNLTVPSLALTAPGSLNEGAADAIASVSIPVALPDDLTVTVSSADTSEILVDDGFGSGPLASVSVFIPAGTTSSEFLIHPASDNEVDGDQSVQITADAEGYDFGQAFVNVLDVNFAAPTVVINKVINNGSADIVELLVVGDGTPESSVDMQGMILKDYSGSGVSDSGGSFTFATSSTWSEVKAGTLVVLTNQSSGTEDLDGTDFVIRANLKNAALFTEAGGFDVGNTEVVQIKAAGSAVAGSTGAIATMAFGSTSAPQVVAAPRPKLVSGNGGTFQVATNATGTLADFDGSGVTLLTSAPTTGIPHNADNAAFISNLRGVQTVSVTIASASAIVSENAGEQTDALTISLSSPAASDVTVNLAASPAGALSLPPSVYIGTGQSSAVVSFTPIGDGIASGNRDVSITASATGYQDGTNAVTLVDAQFNPPSVVINEVMNGGTGAPDSVELLVVESGLNMVGMIFKDFSGNMSGDGGARYTFKDAPLWQSVPAGTLVVLTNDAAATEDSDASDGVVTVKLTNTTYFTSSGSFDISNNDLVMIKAAGSGADGVAGAIHSFGAGTPGTYFNLAGGAKLLGSGAEVSAVNATSTLEDFNGTGATFQAATPGAANNTTNATFIDSLRSAGGAPVISGSLTLEGTVGVAVTPYQITASGSPTSYASGTLPPGLFLDPGTGIISGTPAAAQPATDVQISATNAGGTGNAALVITIGKGTPTVQTAPTASAITEGDALSASALTGGSASVAGTFAWTSPSTIPPLGTAGYAVTFTPTDTANYGTTSLTVNVTVAAADYLFPDWSGGAEMSPELLNKFAVGGAASPIGPGEAPVLAVEGGSLTLTAIVRTNNSSLTVVGEAVAELTGTWSESGVTGTAAGVSQSGVPEGCERQKFSVALDGTKKFLRLRSTLTP